MQDIQLYIEGQRVEMFEDESITLTQSIQNVKDISKIFADYSQTFNLPATKINNKIFKHYYNFDISNGFDARTKKDSTIELNHSSFKSGKIKLEGVDLKENKPHTYKVTFFGDTVALKDLMADDKLSSLSSLNTYDKQYNPADIKNSLATNPSSGADIVTALITHTQRLYYDSGTGHTTEDFNTGNLHYDTGTAHTHGVKYSDLKYSIRVNTIIEAIQSKYAITFSNDFFHSTYAPYYNLFLWLHRKKGDVETLSGVPESIVNTFEQTAYDQDTDTEMVSDFALEFYGQPQAYGIGTELRFETLSTEPYSISLRNDGVEEINIYRPNGGNFIIDQFAFGGAYTIFIQGLSQVQFTKIEWYVSYTQQPYVKSYLATNGFLFNASFDFIITEQIPEIKCIDFITGLFKMFNLTAFIERNSTEIKVMRLDEFYDTGISYDITEYVDTESSSVNVALPYREISFEHGDTDTFLAKVHSEKYNKKWGKSFYDGDEKLDGGRYEITTPFAQMKYERIIDVNGGSKKNAQYGYFVDDNQDSYFGKPLLFYPILQSNVSYPISFVSSNTTHEPITAYNIPSNSVSLNNTSNASTMSFYDELNEYTGTGGFTDTLFQANYSNYITNVFNERNRITRVGAYLPLRILLKYTLADRFIIGGNSYKINTITTNFKTGKSELELINDL